MKKNKLTIMPGLVLIGVIVLFVAVATICQGRTESHTQAISPPTPTVTPPPTPTRLPRPTVRLRDRSVYYQTPTPDFNPASADPGWAGFLHLLHKEVNRVRANDDARKLKYDPFLAEIAQAHSENMARNNQLYHLDNQGRAPRDRVANSRVYQLGWRCTPDIPERPGRYTNRVRIGENLMKGDPKNVNRKDAGRASEVVAGWLRSPPHREVLLKRIWERQGFGLAVAQDGRAYITQMVCLGWE